MGEAAVLAVVSLGVIAWSWGPRSRHVRPAVLVAGCACVLAYATLIAFRALLLTRGCADTCVASRGAGVPEGVDWTDAADAWQWDAHGVIAAGGLVAAVLAVRFASRRSSRYAGVAAGIALGLIAVWLGLLAPAGEGFVTG